MEKRKLGFYKGWEPAEPDPKAPSLSHETQQEVRKTVPTAGNQRRLESDHKKHKVRKLSELVQAAHVTTLLDKARTEDPSSLVAGI